jgi:hypothetical protein
VLPNGCPALDNFEAILQEMVRAFVDREDDERVVESAHVFEILEDDADVVVHTLHAGAMEPACREIKLGFDYLPTPLLAASACIIRFAISAFTASRLKLAPFCIGGYSMKVCSALPTTSWTNTNRQNSYLNHSK